jgi:hypothetical protein
MAITRTQIAKQLLANGGRTGFFLGGNFNPSSTTAAQKSASKGSTTTYNAPSSVATNPQKDASDEARGVGAYKSGVTQAYEIIGGQKRAVITGGPNAARNEEERRILRKIEEEQKQKEIEEFINRPPEEIETPFPIVTTGLNAAQKFLPYKVTRKFYADNQNVLNKYGYDLSNYDQYDQDRKAGLINAYGRPLTEAERTRFDDDSNDNNFIPVDTTFAEAPGDMDQAAETEEDPFRLARAFRADGGPIGGIMDLETSRQMYGLGKLVKKATRAVKKIAKSPIGKAALLYAGGTYLGGLQRFGGAGLGSGTFLSNLKSGQGIVNLGGFLKGKLFDSATTKPGADSKGLFSKILGSPMEAITLASIAAGLTAEQEDEAQLLADNTGIDIEAARNQILNAAKNQDDFRARAFKADGGIMRLGYQEGSKEPVAKKTMPLLDMDGKEMDLREDGGFVPIGRMEKADDVPARLSKNEFVFTADAVRNAGDGNVDKGAEVMYNMMKNLESGGDVSEESQGLKGAREMFQTSQRLEEVL